MAVPMTLAFAGAVPSDCTYWRASGAIADTEPANARPNPSRIDFLPSSMTSGGMSLYLVPTMNSATDFVRPGALGNSAAGPGAARTGLAPRVSAAAADAASE